MGSAEEDNLFVNLSNAPLPAAPSPTPTTITKNLAKGRPEGPAKVPGSDGASPPSDPLSDLLTSPKDETGGSSYETEQELERLLVNPVHSMDNAPNFHAGAPLTIPAPSSSAPPAGPGLWGFTPSQDTPNIQAPLGTIQGLPTNLGLNPGSVHPSTPPTTSMSTRGSGQTEPNSLNAHAPGQSQYMANYQASFFSSSSS